MLYGAAPSRPRFVICTPAIRFESEVLFHEGLAGVLAFVREGLRAGEPVVVVAGAAKIAALSAELGSAAAMVRFVDTSGVADNPGRILPLWLDFVAACQRDGRAARGISARAWAAGSNIEQAEGDLHEALLDFALADTVEFRLLRCWDAGALDPALVDAAGPRQPVGDADDLRHASPACAPPAGLLSRECWPLTAATATATPLPFDSASLHAARRKVADRGVSAGLRRGQRDDLVLVVSELAANSVRHGGGRGWLRVWQADDALVCEVSDRGLFQDPLAGRRTPDPQRPGGRGLWLAHQLSDLVQLRSDADGTVVRVHMRRG